VPYPLGYRGKVTYMYTPVWSGLVWSGPVYVPGVHTRPLSKKDRCTFFFAFLCLAFHKHDCVVLSLSCIDTALSRVVQRCVALSGCAVACIDPLPLPGLRDFFFFCHTPPRHTEQTDRFLALLSASIKSKCFEQKHTAACDTTGQPVFAVATLAYPSMPRWSCHDPNPALDL